MSQCEFLIYVEGWTDRGFYSHVCEAVFGTAEVQFQVRTANEIDGTSGGKQKLLSLYRALADKGALEETFQGKRSVFLFCLDKDLDDLANLLVQSPHIIYTKYYHFENYAFRHGALALALTAGASLDIGHARQIAGDSEAWCRNAATLWKDWVKLCVQASLDGVPGRCRYSTPSPVNVGCDACVDPQKLADYEADLFRRSGQDIAEVQRRRQEISDVVDRLYELDEHDGVFRGRWYAHQLADTVRAIIPAGLRNGLADRISSAAFATLDFDGDWAAHLREPMASFLP
jgi:hypothetical protein